MWTKRMKILPPCTAPARSSSTETDWSRCARISGTTTDRRWLERAAAITGPQPTCRQETGGPSRRLCGVVSRQEVTNVKGSQIKPSGESGGGPTHRANQRAPKNDAHSTSASRRTRVTSSKPSCRRNHSKLGTSFLDLIFVCNDGSPRIGKFHESAKRSGRRCCRSQVQAIYLMRWWLCMLRTLRTGSKGQHLLQ